jgi:hypothetical protein
VGNGSCQTMRKRGFDEEEGREQIGIGRGVELKDKAVAT